MENPKWEYWNLEKWYRGGLPIYYNRNNPEHKYLMLQFDNLLLDLEIEMLNSTVKFNVLNCFFHIDEEEKKCQIFVPIEVNEDLSDHKIQHICCKSHIHKVAFYN